MSSSSNLNEQERENVGADETWPELKGLPFTSMDLPIPGLPRYPFTLADYKAREKAMDEMQELKKQGYKLKKYKSLERTFSVKPGPFHLILHKYVNPSSSF